MAPRPDVEKLTDYVVASIEAGKAVEKPFFHLEFDRIFPEDIYASIIRLMPVAADYRPLPGRRGAEQSGRARATHPHGQPRAGHMGSD